MGAIRLNDILYGGSGRDGHDCQISSIESIPGGKRVTFSYYEDGVPKIETMDVMDGEKGDKGDDGFSPEITIKESTASSYILNIKTADDDYDTPNLKGSGGSGINVTVNDETLVFTY